MKNRIDATGRQQVQDDSHHRKGPHVQQHREPVGIALGQCIQVFLGQERIEEGQVPSGVSL